VDSKGVWFADAYNAQCRMGAGVDAYASVLRLSRQRRLEARAHDPRHVRPRILLPRREDLYVADATERGNLPTPASA
jgi:hypothetical protein